MKYLILLTLTALLNACTQSSEMLCENTGGKWATAKANCIRPSCAKTKTCGMWANPAQFCEKVKIGDSKDTVRFWLGEPDSESDTIMRWTAFKAENAKITAEFNNHVLTKFDCLK